MCEGYVACHPNGDEAALQRLVSDLGVEWLYVESAAWIELLPASALDLFWPHGRAFGAMGEIRWTRHSEGLALHVLTEDQARLPTGDGWIVNEYQADDPQPVLLWGRYDGLLEENYERPAALADEPVWAEVRIPRPLTYPLPAPDQPERSPFVAALRVTYRQDEVPVLTRWAGLCHSAGRRGEGGG
jgi:hypothetical protein